MKSSEVMDREYRLEVLTTIREVAWVVGIAALGFAVASIVIAPLFYGL